MASNLLPPLHLNSTYTTPPVNASATIPFNDRTANYSAGAGILFEGPAGSYYSSINDMRTPSKSVLNSTLISKAQTRRWLKPLSFTASINTSVGAPWGINRAPIEKPTYLYTKGGDIWLYSTLFALLPDYGVGFAVLVLGSL